MRLSHALASKLRPYRKQCIVVIVEKVSARDILGIPELLSLAIQPRTFLRLWLSQQPNFRLSTSLRAYEL